MNKVALCLTLVLLTACGPEPRSAVAPAPTVTSPGSDDSGRILFESGGGLYTMDPEGGSRRRLVDVDGSEYVPRWSPDRSKVAFLLARKGSTALWVVNADGRDPREVAKDVAEHFSWAPDSDHLAFTRSQFISYRKGAVNAMYTVRSNGARERLLTDDQRTGFDPNWSPDGTTIAFTGVTKENGEINQDVYVLDLQDLELHRLTTDPADDWEPRWSPDGSKIAFISARHDPHRSEFGPYTSSLFVMGPDGTHETRLTAGYESMSTEHEWSPDGRRLVYRSWYDDDVAPANAGGARLRIVSVDGKHEALAAGENVGEADWSPTGAWVVYGRDEKGHAEILRIRPGGNEPVVLTDNGVHDVRPDW